MKAEPAAVQGLAVRRVASLPGPHLLRWTGWYLANTAMRRRDVRRARPPDLVYSPGINCPDADAMSVHIVFAKYWEEVGRETLARLVRPQQTVRALHRVASWSLLGRLERKFYEGPPTLTALSQAQARELERRYQRQMGSVPVIPYGVGAGHFSSERAGRREASRLRLGTVDHRVILVVGNDAYNKGVDVALDALREVPSDVILAVAGPEDRAVVLGWALARGVGDRVRLWPHIADVSDYYTASDVVIAPSREDAFSLAPLEAMAAGVPVIVSARAGVADHLVDGRHALILRDPENAGALAQRVRAILDDPVLARHLSQEGQARARELSWDSNARETARLLEREASTPRTLVLAPDPTGTGGIERATRTLLAALGDLIGPERVGLLAVWWRTVVPDLPCRVLVRGALVRREPPGPVGPAIRVAYTLGSVRAAYRWRRRLVVVACHPHLGPVAWMCRLVSGAPYAVWCHGFETWGPLRWSVRAALRRADAIFAPSEFSARLTERASWLPPGSVRVVPHSVSPDLQVAAPERVADAPPVVLTVARLDPEHAYKGVDVLLRAWPLVLHRVPEARLVVAGDGQDRHRLEEMTRSLGLDGAVRFAGRVSDEELVRLYASAAAFALPARAALGSRPVGEGFGIVLLEAGAGGLPVVAGDAGPAPEVVVNGETGILVDPEDEAAVSGAIVELLQDPEARRRMGDAGRKRVQERYSFQAFRVRVAGLLDALAQRRNDLRHDLRSGLWAESTRRRGAS
jgi:glycosyltransferase involved in cell wall biosynthesis